MGWPDPLDRGRTTDLALQNGVVEITMMPVAARVVLPCVDHEEP